MQDWRIQVINSRTQGVGGGRLKKITREMARKDDQSEEGSWSSRRGSEETNLTSIHEGAGQSLASLSGSRIWCCRELWCRPQKCSGLAFLWLRCRPAAIALIRSLAWEPPCAVSAALWSFWKKKIPPPFLFFLFLFLAAPLHVEFLGQGSDPRCSCSLHCSYSNARSFNPLCWAGEQTHVLGTAETPTIPLCHSRNSLPPFFPPLSK